MKNWSIGYEIIRIYVRFGFWLTHKRIVVTGRHLIPKGKPVIFAPNHQNALMDPLALVCTNSHQSVWLARADIFKSKRVGAILKYLKLLPVYRIRDGKDNLSNNEEIFAQVIQLLENNQTIALFPEAAHSGKRQMLPHKKAIPRIALEAEAKNDFKLDLQIVPVGITYSHYWKFNRSLIIQYGQPIQVKDYWIDYELNSQKAMLDLRDEIHRKLVSLILQIDSKTSYPEIENIRQLVGKEYSKRRYFCKDPSLQLFYSEKELVSKLEQLEELQSEHFQNIIAATRQYFIGIEKDDISDDQIENAEKACWSKVFSSLTLAVLTLPIFVFGFVFNAIPFVILRTILRKKVKDVAFLSTFNFVGGLILFPLFYLIAACVLFSWSDSVLVASFTLVGMPFGGKIAYQLYPFYRIILLKILYLGGSKSHKNTINSLLEQRSGLIALILEKVNF
ncbi:1-acyl-sn-glycerol-3-phosphate acyltransferase [Aquipluma nitroreducens]|uniref:1-acyl-sn-glycerol-3-phosphate acyltransferase n=1 Tax=Aquipluma nitroreducens TaxID=2010828 RepID=UPI00296FD955|nr:1-acyl-sn-glycerol-3-phosphate acyltransferase [Aquipluma nitroreducens]